MYYNMRCGVAKSPTSIYHGIVYLYISRIRLGDRRRDSTAGVRAFIIDIYILSFYLFLPGLITRLSKGKLGKFFDLSEKLRALIPCKI